MTNRSTCVILRLLTIVDNDDDDDDDDVDDDCVALYAGGFCRRSVTAVVT